MKTSEERALLSLLRLIQDSEGRPRPVSEIPLEELELSSKAIFRESSPSKASVPLS